MRAVGVVDEVAGSDQRTEQCTQDAAVFDRWFHTAAGGTNHASSAPPGTTQWECERVPGEAEKGALRISGGVERGRPLLGGVLPESVERRLVLPGRLGRGDPLGIVDQRS